MNAAVDYTGQQFGRLTVVERLSLVAKRRRYSVRCDCGAEKVVMAQCLVAGTTTSCGCLHKERLRTKGKNATHGRSRTTEYSIWCGMRKRCENPAAHAYWRYGGRGITVCERWQSFLFFLADMGPRPIGHSIDRVDNDKGYSPGNCRWATPTEQSRNRRVVLARSNVARADTVDDGLMWDE